MVAPFPVIFTIELEYCKLNNNYLMIINENNEEKKGCIKGHGYACQHCDINCAKLTSDTALVFIKFFLI